MDLIEEINWEVIDMETWLTSLITETPAEGYDLAVTLARKAVGMIQPDAEVKKQLLQLIIIGNSKSIL